MEILIWLVLGVLLILNNILRKQVNKQSERIEALEQRIFSYDKNPT